MTMHIGNIGDDKLELRPATAADEKFVDTLLRSTMDKYVKETWPNDPEAWRHYYEINKFDQSKTRIVQLNGKYIGRLTATVRKDCVFIDEMHILSDWQRKGIGEILIHQVFEEARERCLPVKLTVLMKNPAAQRLYLKMGFEVAEEKDHRLHMELKCLPKGQTRQGNCQW